MPTDQGIKNIGGAVPLRFVQIAAAPDGAHDGFAPQLYGLDADGQVRSYHYGRERNSSDAKGAYGPPFYWWQPLRMSAEKGAEFEPPATPKEFRGA